MGFAGACFVLVEWVFSWRLLGKGNHRYKASSMCFLCDCAQTTEGILDA